MGAIGSYPEPDESSQLLSISLHNDWYLHGGTTQENPCLLWNKKCVNVFTGAAVGPYPEPDESSQLLSIPSPYI
jgi:hypothetical protein